MEIQYDIYRINPDSPYHIAAMYMETWRNIYTNNLKEHDRQFVDDPVTIPWLYMSQSDRRFYAQLKNDQDVLFMEIYDVSTPEGRKTLKKIEAEMPDMATFFGLRHPVTIVHSYEDSPPRAYEMLPHTWLFDAISDEAIFPELKSLENYQKTLPKGEPLVINNLPQFAYMACPRHYNGKKGFVPKDAVKLTPKRKEMYLERRGLSWGGGWLDGPGRSVLPPLTGTDLPKNFDLKKHQHQLRRIGGSAHMTTVSERWAACDKEDENNAIPLPPFPEEWAVAHGMAR